MPELNALRKNLLGEMDGSPETLRRFSKDASIFEIKPEIVIAPRNVEDIKNLVRFAKDTTSPEHPIYLTASSGRTDMTGGPLGESIIVDFTKHFNRIKEIGRDSAVVEPGVFYKDFEKETLKHNLLLPSYPASREICTVGGMAANDSGGEKTLKYGKTERYVRKLKMVLSDGNEYEFKKLSAAELEAKKGQDDFEGALYRQIYDLVSQNYDLLKNAEPKVSKNSSGYFLWNVWNKKTGEFDMPKLLVGSQGTFGLITEITFGLVRPKPYSRMLVIFLPALDKLAKIVNHVLAFHPESFESYDDHTFKVAVKFFPDLVKQLKGGIFKLGFEFLPEFWAVLTGGLPKLVLLAEFTGDTSEEALEAAKKAEASLKEFHIKTRVTSTASEAQKYWIVRRESFNLLRKHFKNLRTAPFIDDFIVRPETLPEFLPKLYEILNKYDLTYTIAGHPGDGNFHIIPLMDLKNPKSLEIIKDLSEKVYKLVIDFKGSITGEHNDGLIRSPFVPMLFGEKVYSLFQETKKIFDPKNIFNPGKKVNSSLDYALRHIAQ